MAYDKIIPIRRKLVRCLNYVLNEEKTGLASALEYVENPEKTHRLVTAINCEADSALEDMLATKRRWDKTGGVLGYHIIHSYAPGEVTPEIAHSAGVDFAERLLGDKYEAVVCTHIDREHLHCHIVFNSVSFVDGTKYRDDFKSYFHELRDLSNEVSREYGLSVIEPESRGQHYAEWSAERGGRTTTRDLVRQDIEAAIAESFTFDSFLTALRRQGYSVKYGNVKHPAVCPPGGERFFRLDSLGAGYTEADIRARLAAARSGETFKAPHSLPRQIPIIIPIAQKRYTIRQESIRGRPRRKPKGIRALYLYYMYLLNPPRRPHKLPPFAIRKEATKLQRYQRQFHFLTEYRINTDAELAMLSDAIQAEIDALTDNRKGLYMKKRRGENVTAELDAANQELRQMRSKLKICNQIAEDIPRIRGQTELARQAQKTNEAARQRAEGKTRKEGKAKWM